jgi:hypothetical protein
MSRTGRRPRWRLGARGPISCGRCLSSGHQGAVIGVTANSCERSRGREYERSVPARSMSRRRSASCLLSCAVEHPGATQPATIAARLLSPACLRHTHRTAPRTASDILRLTDMFLCEIAGSVGRPLADLTKEARQQLLNHDWPGNVRDLRTAIKRAAILKDSPTAPKCVPSCECQTH